MVINWFFDNLPLCIIDGYFPIFDNLLDNNILILIAGKQASGKLLNPKPQRIRKVSCKKCLKLNGCLITEFGNKEVFLVEQAAHHVMVLFIMASSNQQQLKKIRNVCDDVTKNELTIGDKHLLIIPQNAGLNMFYTIP